MSDRTRVRIVPLQTEVEGSVHSPDQAFCCLWDVGGVRERIGHDGWAVHGVR